MSEDWKARAEAAEAALIKEQMRNGELKIELEEIDEMRLAAEAELREMKKPRPEERGRG